ncbi:MAG: hypothetical protein RSE41_07325 [Clostridia bacterium]
MEDILVAHKPVKRGRPRKASKKEDEFNEIEQEVVFALCEPIKNYTVDNICISKLLPNVIDNNGIVVTENGDKKTAILLLSNDSTSMALRNWKLGRGGVFLRDAKSYCKGENNKNYRLLTSTSQKAIIRLINNEELPIFETLNLVDGVIGGKKYCLIKLLDVNGDTTSTFTSYAEKSIQRDINEYKEKEKEMQEDDSLYGIINNNEEEVEDFGFDEEED